MRKPSDKPASTTKRLQFFPEIHSHAVLQDIVARASWHFSHVPELLLHIPLAEGLKLPTEFRVPAGFHSDIQSCVDDYLTSITFQRGIDRAGAIGLLPNSDIILKWCEGEKAVDDELVNIKKPVYRVDPVGVRQEGSFYIQCAFDAYECKSEAITESLGKFARIVQRLGRAEQAWVLATGPSMEAYSEYDFSNSITIACNSVVLNDDLMAHCRPKILVFADPIFHFGVSQYAGRFREVVAHRLATTDICIVVPAKYYPLLCSKFPEFADRIVGVPFASSDSFNLDIAANFQVKTTANILTLLLLPLATTFAKKINIIGCDGRPLDRDDHFWGHGATVQINDKMENIKQVHPGFFDIDYNEYYFEHCHTLENLLLQGERQGYNFIHAGQSHIPALRERIPVPISESSSASGSTTAPGKVSSATCVVLEPDGVGTGGHYVRWHAQLTSALRPNFAKIIILCNKKQNPALYACESIPTFSSFSWGVSRAKFSFDRDFMNHQSMINFMAELHLGLLAVAEAESTKTLSVYLYYGSVQLLKALQLSRKKLKELGVELNVTICLFHESVILDANVRVPRFPPGAKEILMEGVAQTANYRIYAVTERLSKFIYDKFGIRTSVFPNPIPGRGDGEERGVLGKLRLRPPYREGLSKPRILFPCSLRDEKGSAVTEQYLSALGSKLQVNDYEIVVRGDRPPTIDLPSQIIFLGENISDSEYWSNLAEADVVVIPYLAPQFSYRTSGIVVDALFAGKPCVVLSDTWLADVILKYGAGLPVRYLSEFSISSAISVILKNYSFFQINSDNAYSAYAAKNSWQQAAMAAIV